MTTKVRSRVGLAAGAAALGLTIAALSTSVISPAEAAPGRRLCVYTHIYTVGEFRSSNNSAEAVFVNYKKGGECPPVDQDEYREAVGIDLSVNQPVPKIYCEGGEEFLWSNPDVVDPYAAARKAEKGKYDMCTEMEKDYVYRYSWSPRYGVKRQRIAPVRWLAPQASLARDQQR